MQEESGRMNILLAVDGSDHSLAAAHMLGDLPCFPGCHLVALMVVVPRLTSHNYYIDSVLDYTEQVLKQGNNPQVETVKLFGANPAETINQFAQDMPADLVVVGAKGLRATLGILLGGVAQQVVEYATCPVLVVRAPYTALRQVLLVTDGSPYSHLACKFLSCFALPQGTLLEVCHVRPPSQVMTSTAYAYRGMEAVDLAPMVPDMLLAQEKQEAADLAYGNQVLAESTRTLEQMGVPVARSIHLIGDAATEILAYADDYPVDLIVAGSRGLSQVQGWLLGSVSRKLVHYAPCSVLIVKGEAA